MDVSNVFLQVKESKRALVLHRNGRVEAIRRAVRSVDESIFVVFDRKEDVPSNASPYILQRYSVEWKDFLDVTCHDVDLILDRDRLQVIPAPSFCGSAAAVARADGPSTSVSQHTKQFTFNISIK